MKQDHLGIIRKLKGALVSEGPIQYQLPIGDSLLPLNPLLGKTVHLSFTGLIQCIACGRKTKKSFQQGYCFPCTQTLAQCDLCIVRPEKCHHHLGTCREPDWAKTHCMIPHIVYMANTSGLKVGITRENQIPTRWIDQGAIQALALARVPMRYHAGLIEVALKDHMADKTDWRKMLKGDVTSLNLIEKREEIQSVIKTLKEDPSHPTLAFINLELLREEQQQELTYPILESPAKITSLNPEKTPNITGQLMGIKGQYLIFDIGVLNVRNIGGYEMKLECLECVGA